MQVTVPPCPFCGGEATVTRVSDRHMPDGFGCVVICDDTNDCKVQPMTESFLTEEEAIAAWSERKP